MTCKGIIFDMDGTLLDSMGYWNRIGEFFLAYHLSLIHIYSLQILVGILAVGIVGFVLAIIMRTLEARVCSWSERGK